MRKTDMEDVYKLYLLKRISEKTVKSKKIDIAYIPSMECTQLCKELTKDNKKVLVICQYNKDKNKWVPIKNSTLKRPNFVDELSQ